MKKKQSMKIFFILIALWLAIIATVGFGSVGYKYYQGSKYKDVAVPYIEQIVPVISTWETAAIRELMVPEVSAAIPEEKFAQTVIWFSKLGALKSTGDPAFQEVDTGAKTVIGMQTIIEYKIDAKYENGDASIIIKLLDRGGSLELYSVNLSSETLLK